MTELSGTPLVIALVYFAIANIIAIFWARCMIKAAKEAADAFASDLDSCEQGRHEWNYYAYKNGHRMCNNCDLWIDQHGTRRKP